MRNACTAGLLMLIFSVFAWSQVVGPVPAELVVYPEMVVYNGKIVTIDDHSFKPNSPGTIAQAMAVRNGKVMALGDNDKIRALAGPQTQVIDLKGRTVLPGLISTHEHTQEYAYTHQPVVQAVVNDKDYVARWVKGETIAQVTENFEPTLKEAVSKAKPGEWIRLEMFRGAADQFRTPFSELLRKDQPITKFLVDRVAPNNPVAVKSGTSMLLNQKAIEIYSKMYGSQSAAAEVGLGALVLDVKKGLGGTKLYRRTENDLIMAGRADLLARLYAEELSWWAGYGFTTVVTHNEGFQMLGAYRLLDKSGQMPMRYGWGYRDYPFNTDPLALRRLGDMVGSGSDYLWLVGMHGTEGGECTTAPASDEVKKKEQCHFTPGSPGYQEVSRIVRAGGRIATMHSGADKDIDYFMDAIENGSREAGFTIDQIRAKRHAFDHCHLAPRPDQVARIKNLGIMVSCQITVINEPSAERWIKDYGPGNADRIIPLKTMADSGIMNSFEIDRPLGHTYRTPFYYLYFEITRRNERGKVIGAGQRIDRVTALKTATLWGGYYALREKELGSLEPGKFADFIVLDRDYMTIPEDDIPNVTVLMTVLGGKVVHLFPQFAGEIGMQPTGAQSRIGPPKKPAKLTHWWDLDWSLVQE